MHLPHARNQKENQSEADPAIRPPRAPTPLGQFAAASIVHHDSSRSVVTHDTRRAPVGLGSRSTLTDVDTRHTLLDVTSKRLYSLRMPAELLARPLIRLCQIR
jgi:hypothetical protein